MNTLQPTEFTTKRYRCPFCGRSRSARSRTTAHMKTCWLNPAVRGCKTCVHFASGRNADDAEHCAMGVDLTVRPCRLCGGQKWPFGTCGECGGAGRDPNTNSLPIVSCASWAPTEPGPGASP